MADTKRVCVILLCVLQFVTSVEILCEEGFCREYQTKEGCTAPSSYCHINNATHSGIWLPSPTTCNCCPYCLPFLRENEFCSTGGPGTGVTVGRCGAGLTCIRDDSDGHNYCKRMTSKCHTAQDDYDARSATGKVGALEQRPHCDGKGRFAPFDCVPAHTCFCQSEEGERIFGEVLNLGTVTTQNMHCGCSRLHEKIKKSIQPGLSVPVTGPRCTSDGNFNPVQCINRTCHCVDEVTGVVLDGDDMQVNLDKKPISELACYDRERDLFPQQSQGQPPYYFTTPCLEDIKTTAELIRQSEKDGFIVEFFNTISGCMPDGTYSRVVKTRNGTKICVDERGRQIEDFEAEPNTSEYETMNCKCAQTSLIMVTSIEKPVCCKNGNFRKIQCRRGMCRCVDSDGRQESVENADVTELPCYKNTLEWRHC